jgi:hypothetical protein
VTTPIVIGDTADPHVEAVVARLNGECVVIDVAALAKGNFNMTEDRFSITAVDGSQHVVERGGHYRGWIRRVAPQDWFVGVVSESKDAAIRTSWLTLLTALIRSYPIEWMSELDSIAAAENKLVMGARARTLGVSMPATLVTNNKASVDRSFADTMIVKPLGPGHYFDGETPFSVFAEEMDPARITDADLREAPFLLQRRIEASAHYRVVTVDSSVFVACLDATGLPADWRKVPAAHHNFVAQQEPELERQAISVARVLHLGYSSQDWIREGQQFHLLDVNPGGQWLFLPPEVGDSVSDAIAGWLTHE